MSASLTDLLTAAKNVVTAVNSLAQTYLGVEGMQAFNGLTAATVATSKAGRVKKVSVVVAGSASGLVYDSNSTSVTANPICAIPTTVGVYDIDMPFVNGLLIVPGTGQTVSGSYSTGGSVGYPNQ